MKDDTISRQAAIDKFEPWLKVDGYSEGELNMLKAVLYELRVMPSAQPKWIPCSEVPDTDRNVFIARGDGNMMTVCIGHYQHDYKQWYEDRNWFAKCLYDGLYWCEIPPLPEPWKGELDG